MAAFLGDAPLARLSPLLSAKEALAGKIVAFYFSAHWCPPCRRFTKILKQFYEESKTLSSDFEVVFVSSDRSESEMKEYLAIQGDWLYLPFGHPAASQLSRRFSVGGIPSVVVVGMHGDVIETGARAIIEVSVNNNQA